MPAEILPVFAGLLLSAAGLLMLLVVMSPLLADERPLWRPGQLGKPAVDTDVLVGRVYQRLYAAGPVLPAGVDGWPLGSRVPRLVLASDWRSRTGQIPVAQIGGTR